jgi:hypothetical protein
LVPDSDAIDVKAPSTAELIEFLESGEDGDTGMPFVVGMDGNLDAAPTLRIQALDQLGRLDPDGSAAYAARIFDQSGSPGEWAIALRNYGRQLEQPDADPGYVSAILELITNPEWQARPTAGYLEAFDAAVHCAAPELVPVLVAISLNAPDRRTRMAATMALESLSGDHPERVARVIASPDSPIEAKPAFRASLMARLDPTRPGHVGLLRDYLLADDRSREELEAFADNFPNFNDFAGHYLLTRQTPRQLAVMAWTDLTALRLARKWRADPEFGEHEWFLEMLVERLERHVQSAVRGGILPPEVQE